MGSEILLKWFSRGEMAPSSGCTLLTPLVRNGVEKMKVTIAITGVPSTPLVLPLLL